MKEIFNGLLNTNQNLNKRMKTLTPQILAMYIGQECKYENETYELVFVSLLGNESQKIGLLKPYMSVTTRPKSFSEVKLMLRPLSSMTEEEIQQAWLLMGWNPGFYASYPKEERTSAMRKFYMERMTTRKQWYEIQKYDDDENIAPNFLEFSLQFPYLLSIGVDLFGLIDAGLALDVQEYKNVKP